MATKRSAKQRRRSRRRAAMVLVPTIAGVFIAGTAFAYWSTTGSGTGTSATGTSATVTVTQLATPTGMVPGGADQPIPFKINNPKTTNQYIASVTITVGAITKISDGSAATGCSASDFSVTQPSAINTDLPPGDTSFSPSGALIHMINSAVNQDGCKSVNVALTFTAA